MYHRHQLLYNIYIALKTCTTDQYEYKYFAFPKDTTDFLKILDITLNIDPTKLKVNMMWASLNSSKLMFLFFQNTCKIFSPKRNIVVAEKKIYNICTY